MASIGILLLFFAVATAGAQLIGRSRHERAFQLWLLGCSFPFLFWAIQRVGIAWWLSAGIFATIALGVLGVAFTAQAQKSSDGGFSNKQRFVAFLFPFVPYVGMLAAAMFLPDRLDVANLPALRKFDFFIYLGAGFIVMRHFAYLTDAQKGEIQISIPTYLLYLTYFPAVIAGPFIAPKDFFKALGNRHSQYCGEAFAEGIFLVTLGLFKQLVLATAILNATSGVFSAATAGHEIAFPDAIGAVIGNSLGYYFVVSGLYDVARGISKLVGLEIPEQFFNPLRAMSISSFVQKWTLGITRFFHSYVYHPLSTGGRGVVAVVATYFAVALWAGYSPTFWMAIALIFVFLGLERYFIRVVPFQLPICLKPIAWLYTAIVMGAIFTIVTSPDLVVAANILGGAIGMHGIVVPESAAPLVASYHVAAGQTYIRNDFIGMMNLFVTCLVAFIIEPGLQNTRQPDWKRSLVFGLILFLTLGAYYHPQPFQYFVNVFPYAIWR